jgi:predicted MFS family arabinose efflux permease
MSAPAHDEPGEGPGFWIVLSLAIASGATAANIYYAQPLIGPISDSFSLNVSVTSLIVTMLQLGYVFGLIFLVPLGDLVENKRLILITLGFVILFLLVASFAQQALVFIAASLLLGISSTATQMIVPVAAHLSPAHKRGQIVGTVTSGLLFGILLARPVSTLIAGAFGWRAMYWLSALTMSAVLTMMAIVLPQRKPAPGLNYASLIGSLWTLLKSTPVLQRRAAYQGLMFGAFSLFWTAVPFLLQEPPFSLGHIALSGFLLTGAAGALVAPLAGWLADKGHGSMATLGAIAMVICGFVLMWIGAKGSLVLLVLAGIVLDGGVQMNLVVGQRAIYALPANIRSRVNAIYMALFFLGGAFGSAISGAAAMHGGLQGVSKVGLAFPIFMLMLFSAHYFRQRQQAG